MGDDSRRRASRLGLLIAAAFGTGCGSGSHTYSLDVGGDEAGGPALMLGPDGDASVGSLSLSASVGVSPLCPGQCTALTATAHGGTPPYALAWDHGLVPDGGPVTVCPDATTTYTVTVKDSSGRSGGELTAASLTASAKVTVQVSAATGGSRTRTRSRCTREARASTR